MQYHIQHLILVAGKNTEFINIHILLPEESMFFGKAHGTGEIIQIIAEAFIL